MYLIVVFITLYTLINSQDDSPLKLPLHPKSDIYPHPDDTIKIEQVGSLIGEYSYYGIK